MNQRHLLWVTYKSVKLKNLKFVGESGKENDGEGGRCGFWNVKGLFCDFKNS
jgi:hypothetical protein